MGNDKGAADLPEEHLNLYAHVVAYGPEHSLRWPGKGYYYAKWKERRELLLDIEDGPEVLLNKTADDAIHIYDGNPPPLVRIGALVLSSIVSGRAHARTLSRSIQTSCQLRLRFHRFYKRIRIQSLRIHLGRWH